MTYRETSLKGQQHDDHCAAKELDDAKFWKNWPEANDAALAEARLAEPLAEPLYVICKSNEIEHLYWSARGWGPLTHASRYTSDTVAATPEPKDGFWTTLERAQELET